MALDPNGRPVFVAYRVPKGKPLELVVSRVEADGRLTELGAFKGMGNNVFTAPSIGISKGGLMVVTYVDVDKLHVHLSRQDGTWASVDPSKSHGGVIGFDSKGRAIVSIGNRLVRFAGRDPGQSVELGDPILRGQDDLPNMQYFSVAPDDTIVAVYLTQPRLTFGDLYASRWDGKHWQDLGRFHGYGNQSARYTVRMRIDGRGRPVVLARLASSNRNHGDTTYIYRHEDRQRREKPSDLSGLKRSEPLSSGFVGLKSGGLRLEAKAVGNYGQKDGACDLVKGGQFGRWSFSAPFKKGTIRLSGAVGAGVSGDDKVQIVWNGRFLRSKGSVFPTAKVESGRITNWKTVEIDVEDLPGDPTRSGVVYLVNHGAGENAWVAVDWIEVVPRFCDKSVKPSAESCNGKDDDCDGLVDDGDLCGSGQWCTAGRCSAKPGPIKLQPGTFQMGPGKEEKGPNAVAEGKRHPVTLTHTIEMWAHEVTQSEFLEVRGHNPSRFKECGGNCPVESVSWHQAAAFCNALSAKKGLPSCFECKDQPALGKPYTGTCELPQATVSSRAKEYYDCKGYRLPTEAEWEYAYRAGVDAPFPDKAVKPPTTDDCLSHTAVADHLGWFCTNARGMVHLSGRKNANGWGFYDMAGNVLEWVADRYLVNSSAAAWTDPLAIPLGDERVIRGGSWRTGAYRGRAAWRKSAAAAEAQDSIGFRVCRSL